MRTINTIAEYENFIKEKNINVSDIISKYEIISNNDIYIDTLYHIESEYNDDIIFNTPKEDTLLLLQTLDNNK